ncbi:helix-turn-helix domain-containing protein [Natronorarus salvus]|uniref:helix-turn-helix domain-containing protein n=1 Tax=Natronorarus salvus TaxID=3117733 RepID=UPI002F25EE51
MATIAEFDVASEEFALSETRGEVPDAEFEVERVVAHDRDRLMPFVWISADDLDAIERALAEDRTIADHEVIADLEDERLYRMEWIEDVLVIVHILTEEEGTVLTASGRDDRWHFRVLFPDHSALSATHDFARDAGLAFDVTKVYKLDDDREGRFGLSEEQYSALVEATERGYFDVPRSTSLEELASEMGISHQSLSERLRRAQRSLNENTILIGGAGREQELRY